MLGHVGGLAGAEDHEFVVGLTCTIRELSLVVHLGNRHGEGDRPAEEGLTACRRNKESKT